MSISVVAESTVLIVREVRMRSSLITADAGIRSQAPAVADHGSTASRVHTHLLYLYVNGVWKYVLRGQVDHIICQANHRGAGGLLSIFKEYQSSNSVGLLSSDQQNWKDSSSCSNWHGVSYVCPLYVVVDNMPIVYNLKPSTNDIPIRCQPLPSLDAKISGKRDLLTGLLG